MKNVLLITSSPRGEASHSTAVATQLAQQLGPVSLRNLWQEPLPAIDPAFVFASRGGQDASQFEKELKISNELIAEIRAADVIVVAAGLMNFGMPATLKTYIDYIARPRETFSYGPNGLEGLLKGKKMILVLAYGGDYTQEPMRSMDHMEPHLRTAFAFMGITDVETVRIEGVAYGEEAALARANERVTQLLGSCPDRELATV